MARIRSIKPEFFRHEGLQDLEQSNPGCYAMLVFAGLWGHCDRAGRFEWRPRQLKLDILPFLSFDMAATLRLLESHGLVSRYTVDGRDYGFIPTFTEHQRITGKEALEPCKYPEPGGETTGKQQGNNGDHPVAQEGKGREGEQEREGKVAGAPAGAASAPSVTPSLEGFDEAWAAYPRKVAKAEARKAWVKAKPPLQAVLSALAWQSRSQQWQRDGGAYIPHMATWLNQRRWEDEPDARAGPVPVSVPSEPLGAWRDECVRLHGGACGNQHFHAAKLKFQREAVGA